MPNVYDDIISDMYKDAHGHRPGSTWLENFARKTDAEQDAVVALLQNDIRDQEAEAEEYRRAQEIKWNADLAKLQSIGARDRQEAIRWYMDGFDRHEKEYGAEYFAYCHHLPRSVEREIKPYCFGRD